MKREQYLPETPRQVKVSLTNVCNYHCIMCPNPSFKQPRGFMDDSLAFHIIDDCVVSRISRLSLGSSGEVLLHKGFSRYLRYAKERGLWVSTTTNCSALTPDMTDEIVSLGINRMSLSVYSATPEEHRRYCASDNFDTVVGNVKYFLERWNATGRFAEVIMGFLSIPNVNDESVFMRFWEPIVQRYGLKIVRKEATNWAGKVDIYKHTPARRRWSMTQSNGQLSFRCSRVVPCDQLPSYVYILHDGTVLPCCNLPDATDHPEMQFGNVRESSILEIWRTPRFRRFREDHFRCRVRGYAPCVSCEARFKVFEVKPWAVFRQVLTGQTTAK